MLRNLIEEEVEDARDLSWRNSLIRARALASSALGTIQIAGVEKIGRLLSNRQNLGIIVRPGSGTPRQSVRCLD